MTPRTRLRHQQWRQRSGDFYPGSKSCIEWALLRLTKKVRPRHTNAVSVARYRQHRNVDRVASVEGFGGNDVDGGSNPQHFAPGEYRNTVGAGESLFRMMDRQQYAQSAPLGKAANSIEDSHLVPKIK